MPTLQEQFPGIPSHKFSIYPVGTKFSTGLTAGKFVFENLIMPLQELPNSQGAILSNMSLTANINSLTFSNAIDPDVNNGFFLLNVIRAGNANPINLAPFRFSSFEDASNFISQFLPNATEKGSEQILLSISGTLIQTQELIDLGIEEISIMSRLNVYRTTAREIFNKQSGM